MKTTPIYGLPYIEPADLVSSAPAQFKTMAEGFETALNEVDSRNTPAGVKPAIATTLEALAGIAGVTGQTGYVTADPAESNNGPYCWTGSAWLRYATMNDIAAVTGRRPRTGQTHRKHLRHRHRIPSRQDRHHQNLLEKLGYGSWNDGIFGTLPEGWRLQWI